MTMYEVIREQLIEYIQKRKALEKELVAKIRNGEDYSEVWQKVVGLKALEEQCLLMMAKHKPKEEQQ